MRLRRGKNNERVLTLSTNTFTEGTVVNISIPEPASTPPPHHPSTSASRVPGVRSGSQERQFNHTAIHYVFTHYLPRGYHVPGTGDVEIKDQPCSQGAQRSLLEPRRGTQFGSCVHCLKQNKSNFENKLRVVEDTK